MFLALGVAGHCSGNQPRIDAVEAARRAMSIAKRREVRLAETEGARERVLRLGEEIVTLRRRLAKALEHRKETIGVAVAPFERARSMKRVYGGAMRGKGEFDEQS